jgi:hypothetical protein
MSSGSTNIIPTRHSVISRFLLLMKKVRVKSVYEMQEPANDRRFLSTICFTDESTFTLNNEPNVQNTRYWAQENLRVNIPTRIHIWAGIFNNNIVGPFEIKGNLNSANYLDLLLTA